jgi:DNA polymerase I-like protein with 3'-5' exonuclease and polymerase domains
MINEIDEAEAKRIVAMYHDIYPGIRTWYDHIKMQLQKDRTLTNCFGRTVRFLGPWADDTWKSAYSMLPQSTIVDSLNIGMLKIYQDAALCGTAGCNADILAQVHDSVLMQFPIESLREKKYFDSVLTLIKDYTSPDITYNSRTFKIASDFKFGVNWGGYDADKNPGGMQEFEDYDSFVKALEGWEKLNGSGVVGLA